MLPVSPPGPRGGGAARLVFRAWRALAAALVSLLILGGGVTTAHAAPLGGAGAVAPARPTLAAPATAANPAETPAPSQPPATTGAPVEAVAGGKLAALRAGTASLRVGTDATFPPFEFTGPNQEKLGFDIELVNALAKTAGIQKVEFQQIPFANIVPALQAHQLDMGASSIYISEARAKVVDFSDTYYPGGLGIFVADDNSTLTDLAGLSGKKVAVQVGTKSVEWLREHAPAAELVTVQTNDQMFQSVSLGQADALVTGIPAGKYYIQQHGGLKQAGGRLTQENYGYAFQKEDAELRVAFNEALVTLKQNGEYEKLTAKWFGDESAPVKAGTKHLINLSSITDSWGPIGKGLLVTLQVIALSILVSVTLGLLMGLARLSRIAPLRWIAAAYVSVIRGTPFVVQMFLLYFGLPQLGLQIPPMVAGVVALGVYSGSYVTEIVRGAVLSVDKGQHEASRSCGMSAFSTMRYVIIPQAFLRMLPPMGNELVSLTKNSALVSFITISELFLVGQAIISRTFDALTVYLFIGLVYYVLTNLIGFATARLEKKLAVYN